MQTPNPPKGTPTPAPKKEEQPKKPEQQNKPGQQVEGGKKTDKHDPNLPTVDHLAAKENAEVPPNDETMSDQQGAYRLPEGSGGGQPLDRNTMSNQPGPTRGKGE